MLADFYITGRFSNDMKIAGQKIWKKKLDGRQNFFCGISHVLLYNIFGFIRSGDNFLGRAIFF